MSQEQDLKPNDPYKMGEPPSSSDSPQEDQDADQQGLADEQDKEGLGELEQALQKHGFKDPIEAVKAFEETKKSYTQATQEKSEAQKRYEQLQAELESKQAPQQKEETISNEELSQMFLDNPQKATEYMREQIVKESGIDELKQEIQNLKAETTWTSKRTSDSEFANYEDKVKEQLKDVFNDPTGQKAIDLVYQNLKMQEQMKDLNDKKEQGKQAKEQTEAQAKKAAAASESGSSAPQSGDDEEMVSIPGIGKIAKSQLDLVDKSQYLID